MKGINLQRIIEISLKTIDFKKKKIYPFNKKNLFPDAIVPRNIEPGSREHALFLFHAISLDSMNQATNNYKIMRNITEDLGGDLNSLEKISKKDMHMKIGLNGQDFLDSTEILIENAKRIKKYGNDPRKLKSDNIYDTIKKISQFRQYGEAKSCLFIKNLVKFGMWDFPEYEIPIKVDRHVIRISLGCGIINTKEYEKLLDSRKKHSKKLIEAINQLERMKLIKKEDFENGEIKIARTKDIFNPLTEAYLEATKKEKISAIELDDALFGLGSILCKKNNRLNCEYECPIKCFVRPPSDNHANWFFLGIDKRKYAKQLFFPWETSPIYDKS